MAPSDFGISAMQTSSHCSGHCCRVMNRLISFRHTRRCMSDIARRWPYVMPDIPGAELACCCRISAVRSAIVIGSRTSVKSTASTAVRMSVSLGETTVHPSNA